MTKMNTLTIRISDFDLKLLNLLAEQQTKTNIVLSAIRQRFEESLADKNIIRLSENDFNEVLKVFESEMSSEEIIGRKNLAKAKMWD
ncbi:DUF1778 domain-containing protein [uncultured Parasutterella sp.]|uniref:type II toxin -antitoxin system TacA 1-like antitoxin n=1 Tax=uncultured Parasutterella sp. TaxID=1263098 RepID=UPI00262D5A2C|nr:DUF1778 domain-containing protein [uncultured Parasutterella sp.]